MSDERSATYRRSELVDTSQVGDRVVLYHRESGESLVLNPTGARLWEWLDDTHHFDDLADRLAQENAPVEPEQVMEDVLTFLRQLSQHDAIVVGPQ